MVYQFFFGDSGQTIDSNLYKNIINEGIILNGVSGYYLQRIYFNKEIATGEFLTKIISSSIPIRFLPEDQTSFGSEGILYSKFGLQLLDRQTIFLPTLLTEENNFVPTVGDLIYVPIYNNRLFEIVNVEIGKGVGDFFMLNQTTAYKLDLVLFKFDNSEIANEINLNQNALQNTPVQPTQAVDDMTKLNNIFNITNNSENTVPQSNQEINNNASQVIDNTEENKLGGL